jgi:hypothetical protein
MVPLIALQWNPAYATVTAERSDPSTHRAYFRPLLAYLAVHAEPLGRVEVVPTQLHWEAAYTAPQLLLARGWERQLDRADNPIFYGDDPLDAEAYRAWLLDNGVRYVALPDVPLDYAAQQEGRVLGAGVAGLAPVWRSSHWRVFAVSGATGIVDGPGRITQVDGTTVRLRSTRPGTIVVRIRYSPRWTVHDGAACLSRTRGGWLAVHARGAGTVRLDLRLTGTSRDCG